jgi:hypothetical protein
VNHPMGDVVVGCGCCLWLLFVVVGCGCWVCLLGVVVGCGCWVWLSGVVIGCQTIRRIAMWLVKPRRSN